MVTRVVSVPSMADAGASTSSAATLLQGLPVRKAEHFSLCKEGGPHRFQVDAGGAQLEQALPAPQLWLTKTSFHAMPQVVEAATYIATHDRTLPPHDQGASLFDRCTIQHASPFPPNCSVQLCEPRKPTSCCAASISSRRTRCAPSPPRSGVPSVQPIRAFQV